MHGEPVAYIFEQVGVNKGERNNQQLLNCRVMNIVGANNNACKAPNIDKRKVQFTRVSGPDILLHETLPENLYLLHMVL